MQSGEVTKRCVNCLSADGGHPTVSGVPPTLDPKRPTARWTTRSSSKGASRRTSPRAATHASPLIDLRQEYSHSWKGSTVNRDEGILSWGILRLNSW